MTHAYFDCFSGASGDMILGALVDAGASLEGLIDALNTLNVPDWNLESVPVMRCGIGATHVKVVTHEHHHHRGFTTIKGIIEQSPLNDAVKRASINAFRRLAEAEATVHQVPLDKVHFHEVGAVDAIIDIVGAMWALDALGITKVTVSPLVAGFGTVNCAHGTMPVPAPATALMLKDVPWSPGVLEGEYLTPTGAAILTTIADTFGRPSNFVTSRIGHGAGSRVVKGHTNYLRLMLGDENPASTTTTLPVETESITVLECEIDDMTPEAAGFVVERLFAAGCLDAHLIPVQMKKNRPAFSLRVLAKQDDANELAELIFRETTTFGLRVDQRARYALAREMMSVETQYGPVRIKFAFWGDETLKFSPEHDDLRRIAQEHGVPLAVLQASVTALVHQKLNAEA